MNASVSDREYAAVRRKHRLPVPFERFVHAFESLLGIMKMEALPNVETLGADQLRTRLAASVGPFDFSLFQKFDHGALITVLGSRKARAVTYVFGNALIAVEMTKHIPGVGLYVPLRLFVQEVEPERIEASYDLPSRAVAQFASNEASSVASSLDAKVERILAEAVRVAQREST